MPNVKDGGVLNFKINFQSQTSALNNILQSLNQIQNKANKVSIDQPVRKAADAAKNLESIINQSWNVKLNQLNLDKLNEGITKSYGGISQLKSVLSSAGAQGQGAFNSLATQILNTNLQIRQSNKLLDDLATSMSNTVKWGITSSIFNNITGSIQKAYYYSKDLDRSLNEIRIVTGDSADQMDRFARIANTAARDLGRSTLDYTKAALSFYQQGLSDQEVQARTEVTLKAQNITGAGSQMVDYLTAVLNGFQISAEKTQLIVDKLAKVADSSASDMSQLAIAMSKVASTANVMGVDIDQLTAQLATVIATTRQAPEAVGTAFKTIYTRMNDIKTGAEDAEISLGRYSGVMASLGFNVLDANGQLRDTGEVIEQVGDSWANLTKEQKVYLAQTVGGQRQITQVMALFDNWTRYSDLLNDSLSAQGTLNQKNDIYLESTAAHLKQLQAETQRTYAALFDTEVANGFFDVMKAGLSTFNDFIEGLGGGANAFLYFGSVAAGVFNKQITQGIITAEQTFARFKANISAAGTKTDTINAIKDRITTTAYAGDERVLGNKALEAQAAAAEKILAVQKGLTEQQQKEAIIAQETIGKATQKLELINKQEDEYKKLVEEVSKENNILTKDGEVSQVKIKNRLKQLEVVRKLVDQMNQFSIGESSKTQEEFAAILEKNRAVLTNALNGVTNNNSDVIKTFDSFIEKLKIGVMTSEEIETIWGQFSKYFDTADDEAKQLVGTLNSISKGSKQNFEGQRKGVQQVLDGALRTNSALEQSGKHAIFLQDKVRLTSAAAQTLSSLAGAISTGFAEGATGADRLNASFTALTGTAGAIANYIAPGSGFLIQGVLSFTQSILKATGAWQALEEHFKSSEEKLQDLKERAKEIGQINVNYGNSKQAINDIAKEFEELARKRRNNITLSEEEQSRYHELVDIITKYNDDAILGYDAKGNKIVDNNNLIKQTLELLDKQYEKEMRNAYSGEEFEKAKRIKNQNYSEAFNEWEDFNDEDKQKIKEQDSKAIISELVPDIRHLSSFYFEDLLRTLSDDEKKYNDVITLQQQFYDIINGNNDEIRASLQKYIKDNNKFVEDIEGGNNDAAKIALDSLLEFLTSELDIFKELLPTAEERKAKKEELESKLEESGQIDIADVLSTLRWNSDFNKQYNKIKRFWGDNFQELGSSLVETSLKNFINGISEEAKKGNLEKDAVDNLYDYAIEKGEDFLNKYSQIIRGQTKDISDARNELAKIDLNQTIPYEKYQKQFDSIVQKLANSFKSSLTNEDLKDEATKILQSTLGLDNLEINVNGDDIIASYTTQIDKIRDSLSKLTGQSSLFNINLEGILEPFKLTQNEFLSLISLIENSQAEIKNTPKGIQEYIEGLIGSIRDEGTIEAVIANLDKIESFINKLTSGKDLTWKEKYGGENSLAASLGISNQELKQFESNERIIEQIQDRLFTTLQAGDTSVTELLVKTYSSLDQLQQDKEEFGDSYIAAQQMFFDKQIEALGASQEALELYAKSKDKLMKFDFDTPEGEAAIIQAYKLEQGLSQIKSTVSSLKDETELTSASAITQVQFLSDSLRNLGIDLDAEQIIRNFDAIAYALEQDIDNADEFNQKIEEFSDGISSVEELEYQLEEINSIIEKISNQQELTQSEEFLLSLLEEHNGKIKQIEDSYGRYSENFKEALQLEQNANKRQLLSQLKQTEAAYKRIDFINEQIDALKQTDEIQSSVVKRAFTINQLHKIRQQLQEKYNLQVGDQEELKQKIAKIHEQLLDEDVQVQQWKTLTDYLMETAEASEELGDYLANDREAAMQLAEDMLRYDSALAQVLDKYDEWEAKLSSPSFMEHLEVISELKNVYSDLFGLSQGSTSLLPESFFEDIDNLHLLKQISEGNIEAYDALRATMAEQLWVNLNLEGFGTFEEQMNTIYGLVGGLEEWKNIDMSVDLLGYDQFKTHLQDMMNAMIASGKTAEEAANIIRDAMGMDVEVEEHPEEAEEINEMMGWVTQTSYHPKTIIAQKRAADGGLEPVIGFEYFPDVTYKENPTRATSKKQIKTHSVTVKSAHKTAGGEYHFSHASHGAGSVGTTARTPTTTSNSGRTSTPRTSTPRTPTPRVTTVKEPKQQKPAEVKSPKIATQIEKQKDLYHDINIQIQHISNKLKDIKDLQEDLVGDDLLKNLQAQLQVLKQQEESVRRKLDLQLKERAELQVQLANRGALFDSNWDISNYNKILDDAWANYQSVLREYRDLSYEDQQAFGDDRLKQAENYYKDLVSLIKEYDSLNNDAIRTSEEQIKQLQKQQKAIVNRKEPQSDFIELLQEQKDRYHDINIQIDKISRNLSKVQRESEKLIGADLIANLERQVELLEEKAAAQERNLEIQREQTKELKQQLANQGVLFYKDGSVANYAEAIAAEQQKVNEVLLYYNSLPQYKQQDYKPIVDEAIAAFDKFKEILNKYEELNNEQIPETIDRIEELVDEEIELKIKASKVDIEVKLDVADAKREFNKFKKEIMKDFGEGVAGERRYALAQLDTYYQTSGGALTGGSIKANIDQGQNILEQLRIIDAGQSSDIYGTNKAAALADLKEYLQNVIDDAYSVKDIIDSIKVSMTDFISQADEAFQDRIEGYEHLLGLLDHQIKITKLLYGEQAYDMLNSLYSAQESSLNSMITFAREERDFWASSVNKQKDFRDTFDYGTDKWKQAQEALNEYKRQYKASVQDLNNYIERAIQNIIDKYQNAIKKVFDGFTKQLTGGKSFSYLGEEWQSLNTQADLYLDKVNSAYRVDKLERSFKQAIKNNNGNIKAQSTLNALMQQQLDYLRKKDKLSEYDVSRAEALLDIEQKRIALENSQDQKTNLRLRRDTQGNYNYEYTSMDEQDQELLKQELLDAQNDLYNLTKEHYIEDLNTYYTMLNEMQSKIQDVYLDNTLSEGERAQKIYDIRKLYEGMMYDLTARNEQSKQLLLRDSNAVLESIYADNANNFSKMLYQDGYGIIPQWSSGLQALIEEVMREGGIRSVIDQVVSEANSALGDYMSSLSELQAVADVTFSDVNSVISDVIGQTQELNEGNEELIDSYADMQDELYDTIQEAYDLNDAFMDINNTILDFVSAASAYITSLDNINKSISDFTGASSNTSDSHTIDTDVVPVDAGYKVTRKDLLEGTSQRNSYDPAIEDLADWDDPNLDQPHYEPYIIRDNYTPQYLKDGTPMELDGTYSQESVSNALQEIIGDNPKPTYDGGQRLGPNAGWYPDINSKTGWGWWNGAIIQDKVSYGSLVKFDTGGYTGSWGDNPKMALLDEKELILNQYDTKNILSAVDLARSMSELLQSIHLNNMAAMNSIPNNNSKIDQNVDISAHFPNVTNADQIEMALNNLVNRASQYAFNMRI